MSDVCGLNKSTIHFVVHIEQPQRPLMLARGPTATLFDVCGWKLSYVLYQCPDDRPKALLEKLSSMIGITAYLVVTTELMHVSNSTTLLIRTTSN